jgi:NTE family protein
MKPTYFDVISNSILTMQDFITRVRLAGDPPDILLQPHVDGIGLMEFNRASEAIEAGRQSVVSREVDIKRLAHGVEVLSTGK